MRPGGHGRPVLVGGDDCPERLMRARADFRCGTTLACNFRKCSRELPCLAGSSRGAQDRTARCPQHLVCVIGALDRFPHSFTVNETREKTLLPAVTGAQNKLDKLRVRPLTLSSRSRGFACLHRVHRDGQGQLGSACQGLQHAHEHELGQFDAFRSSTASTT